MKLTITTALFLILITAQQPSFAQSDLLNGIQNHITINHDNGAKEIFDVSTKAPKAKPQRLYHWYASQKVHNTQGGYSGKLLDGDYSSYYPNKQLARQGKYRKGLADGNWKEWRENQRLAKIEKWKNGYLSGKASLYDERGNLTESGTKKDGEWHGKVYTFVTADSSYQWIYYDHGTKISKEAYTDASLFRRTGRFVTTLWDKLFHKKVETAETVIPEQP